MSRYIYRISTNLHFPEGIMPGEGRESNFLSIARDGLDRPVLRGTSLAGVLRSQFNENEKEQSEKYWFGNKLEPGSDVSQDSRVIVADMVLDTGNSGSAVRTHNLVNRHTGVVFDRSLFSIESLPPGTSGKLLIYIINSSEDSSDGEDHQNKRAEKESESYRDDSFILQFISRSLGSGLTFGGNRNRGIGRMECQEKLTVSRFDAQTAEGYAAWINTRFADRVAGAVELSGHRITDNISKGSEGEPAESLRNEIARNYLDLKADITSNTVKGAQKIELLTGHSDSAPDQSHFVIELKLSIPRGEDMIVGYGTTMEHQSEPQKIVKADGKEYWMIPGSAFRGVFRGWMSRLAGAPDKHDKYTLRDSAQKYHDDEDRKKCSGSELGWGFIPQNEREDYKKVPDKLDDPVMSLFGSLYRRGRIHFADAFSIKEAHDEETQIRAHVAVDRFSGGANEGMLFDNRVLVSHRKDGEQIGFLLRIEIKEPKDEELEWLEKSLKALHLGILSFGSSKGSGRLEITEITRCSATPKAEALKDNLLAFMDKLHNSKTPDEVHHE